MEQIEQRKEKAAELSSGRHANTDYAPKLTPYERKKQCSLCNVTVGGALPKRRLLPPKPSAGRGVPWSRPRDRRNERLTASRERDTPVSEFTVRLDCASSDRPQIWGEACLSASGRLSERG